MCPYLKKKGAHLKETCSVRSTLRCSAFLRLAEFFFCQTVAPYISVHLICIRIYLSAFIHHTKTNPFATYKKCTEFYLFVSLFIIVLINGHLFILAAIAHITHTIVVAVFCFFSFSEWVCIWEWATPLNILVFIEKIQINNKPYPWTICEATTNSSIESWIEMNKLKKWAYRNVERKRKRSNNNKKIITYRFKW